jgi:hypothetical protein
MSDVRPYLIGPGLALLAGVWLLACGGGDSGTNPCGGGTPPSLAGAYDLVSYTAGGSTVPVPPASGTLTLTSSVYAVRITVPGVPDVIYDSGTYALNGTKCLTQNSVLGQPQFTGTYTYSNGELAVDGTAAGQAVASSWRRR